MLFDNIRKLSEARGMSIRQLERKLGIANGTIGKWNRQSPRIATILPVADYFGVTLDELVRGNEERKE